MNIPDNEILLKNENGLFEYLVKKLSIYFKTHGMTDEDKELFKYYIRDLFYDTEKNEYKQELTVNEFKKYVTQSSNHYKIVVLDAFLEFIRHGPRDIVYKDDIDFVKLEFDYILPFVRSVTSDSDNVECCVEDSYDSVPILNVKDRMGECILKMRVYFMECVEKELFNFRDRVDQTLKKIDDKINLLIHILQCIDFEKSREREIAIRRAELEKSINTYKKEVKRMEEYLKNVK